MFGIGGGEVLVVALVALLLFGNEDLPKNMRKMVKAWNNFRGVTNDLQRSWLDVRDQVARDLLTDQTHEERPRLQSENSDAKPTGREEATSAEMHEDESAHANIELNSDVPASDSAASVLPIVQAADGSVAQGDLNSPPSHDLTVPEKSGKSI